MGEVPCDLLKRVSGGAGGYDFEVSDVERRSMCGEGDRFGDSRTGWEVGEIVTGWET